MMKMEEEKNLAIIIEGCEWVPNGFCAHNLDVSLGIKINGMAVGTCMDLN